MPADSTRGTSADGTRGTSADGAEPDPNLFDDSVRLRWPDARDLDAIDAGIHDPDVIRWIGPPEGTAEEVLALNRSRAAAGSPTFAICQADGACVGLVWVNRGTKDPTVGYVGYWILPDVRGRGLATRAVRLISGWALRELGCQSLGLTTDDANVRSQAVAERSGFRCSKAAAGPLVARVGASRNILYTLDPDAASPATTGD